MVDINISIPNNVIYETSKEDRIPVFSNTTGTITSSDIIISEDDITKILCHSILFNPFKVAVKYFLSPVAEYKSAGILSISL